MREITIACGDYDRTAALIAGQIQTDGLTYRCVPLYPPSQIFYRMFRYEEFDLSEMSFSTYCTALGLGDRRFVGLPVFLSRTFRHGHVYVREGSGVETPEQLRGRRVGTAEYEMTAGVWIRGFLKDDFGVDAHDVEWVTERTEKVPGIPHDPRIVVHHPDSIDLEHALLAGEIDAVATAAPIKRVGGIRRLFDDPRSVEQDYFRRTRVFPIMHMVVMRRALYEEQPWLARSLYKAFVQAKQAAQARPPELIYTVPWVIQALDEARAVLGPDPWSYGVEQNQETLLAFTRHLVEQGLTEQRLELDDVFVPVQWTNESG